MTTQITRIDENNTAMERYAVLGAGADDIKEAIEANLTQGQNISLESLGKITVPSGGSTAWTIPGLEGETVVNEFTGVIIGWRDNQAWWERDLAAGGDRGAPDCRSSDGVTGNGRRVINGKEETGPRSCKTCPLYQFDSGRNGRGKACKSTKPLYVMLPDSVMPMPVITPAGSLGVVNTYFKKLLAAGLPYYGVETTFTLVKEKNADKIAYSKMELKVAKRLSKEEKEAFRNLHTFFAKYINSADVVLETAAVPAEPEHDGVPAYAVEDVTGDFEDMPDKEIPF